MEKSTMGVSVEDVARVLERRQKKNEDRKQAFKDAVESGEKKLVLDRTPTGLYYLQFRGGGALPEELKGKFTSIDTIRKRVVTRYGKDILECQFK